MLGPRRLNIRDADERALWEELWKVLSDTKAAEAAASWERQRAAADRGRE